METIKNDPKLVAYCGLYCGACKKYTLNRCPGCHDNIRATWCGVRQCCIDNSYSSCADCTIMPLEKCKKYNNVISKIVGFIFKSNRAACIERIKHIGLVSFASEMADKKMPTIKR
jgi:hypothetical protein